LIELSVALKDGVEQTVSEMLRSQETAPREVVNFPTVKVSFVKPSKGTFKVLKREDLSDVGLAEGQEVYIFQEV
jgi:hypothetical protein